MADHVREHRSLLAAAEKRLLVRMAGHMPASIHSDHLTALALAAMGLAGAGFWLARWDDTWLWVVVVALALNWFGDSLDGTLARVRGVERPRYGFYVDHVIDIVGITFLLTGLACSGFMTPVIALSLLVAYLLVSGEVFLATAVRNVFRMSFAGMGPTELRILLSVGAIALRGDPHVSVGALGRAQLFDVGGVIAIAGLLVALGWAIVKNTSALARLEPRQQPNHVVAKRVAVAFFALASLTCAQPAAAQPTDKTLDEQVRVMNVRHEPVGHAPIGNARVGQKPIETPSHQPELGSSDTDTSPARDSRQQMNQSQQGRRKRWGALIPLIAFGGILLLAWLTAPST